MMSVYNNLIAHRNDFGDWLIKILGTKAYYYADTHLVIDIATNVHDQIREVLDELLVSPET